MEFKDKDGNKFVILKDELIDVVNAIFKSSDTHLKRCVNCDKLCIWIHGYCDDVCKGIRNLEEYNFSECWKCKGVFCKKCSLQRDLRQCNKIGCKLHDCGTAECYFFACRDCRIS